MSMSDTAKRPLKHELVVGIFFLIAMVILAYFTIILSPSSFIEKSVFVKVNFKDVGALKNGDGVRVRGVSLGKVTELKMNDEYTNVVATLSLKGKPILYKDYKITIHNSSVLGGQYIKVDVGTKTEGVYDYAKNDLEGGLPADVFVEVGKGMQSAGEFFEEAKSLVEGLKEDRKHLNTALKNFAEVSEKVKRGEGTIGKLLVSEDIYKEIEKTMKTLQKAGASVEENVAEFGHASKELKKFGEKLNTSEGTLHKLLSEDDIYNDLKLSVANVKNFSEGLKNKDNSLVKLLNDKGALYADLEKSFANVKEVTTKLNKGEGTLAKLINEDTLHKEASAVFAEAKKALKEVNHAIQDLREQAPISTFGGILLNGL